MSFNSAQDSIFQRDLPDLGVVKGDTLEEVVEKMYNQYHLPDDVQFVIGTTIGAPSVGSNSYNNASLAGKRFRIARNGVGIMIKTIQYTEILTGGFTLVGSDVFGDGEQFTIQFI